MSADEQRVFWHEALYREKSYERDFPTACPIGSDSFFRFLCSLVRRIIKERRITDVPGAIVVADVPDEV